MWLGINMVRLISGRNGVALNIISIIRYKGLCSRVERKGEQEFD